MPSKSPAQRRLMQGASHNAAFAKKVGISQDVARDFEAADELKGGKHKTRVSYTKLGNAPR